VAPTNEFKEMTEKKEMISFVLFGGLIHTSPQQKGLNEIQIWKLFCPSGYKLRPVSEKAG
jgi:hypothetical protein